MLSLINIWSFKLNCHWLGIQRKEEIIQKLGKKLGIFDIHGDLQCSCFVQKPRFPCHPVANVCHLGSPGSTRAQPWDQEKVKNQVLTVVTISVIFCCFNRVLTP